MAENESYKIRFFHGVRLNNEPIYTYEKLTSEEYETLYESLLFSRFSKDVEKAYELIVFNYRDYELNNFTTILNNVLSISDANSFYAAINGIDRHILNILTSTYLYTSLLRIKRKNNDKDDYSIENSDEIVAVHEVKADFKKTTNKYHREHYEYTFVSALRNRINHGGILDKSTELGGSWSIRYEPIEPETEEVVPRKDKKYSLFDQKILKLEAKNIINNTKHYYAVENTIPQSFYLREAMRIYIDLLSTVHSEIRLHFKTKLKVTEELVFSYINKQESCISASLVKYIGNEEKNVIGMGSCKSQAINDKDSVKAPLHLKHYSMPGEPAAVPKCR